MKTRAAVAYAPNQPLVIEEVDLEGPRAGEVLVELEATGIEVPWGRRRSPATSARTARPGRGTTPASWWRHTPCPSSC